VKKGKKKMLAKITAKNQITIPKKIIDQMPGVKYFDVELKGETIVLKPLRTYRTDLERIRSKMKTLGLNQDSVAEAIRWARSNQSV
jgi:bifunctional DNA-binding transcriptional regulator/antitoxin component of YhaV-PrlF toxin-antitoxin module